MMYNPLNFTMHQPVGCIEKSSELVHEKCIQKRTDFPLEMVRMTPITKRNSPDGVQSCGEREGHSQFLKRV